MREGSGGALRENAQDVFRALRSRKPRDFVEVVAARPVPRDDLVVDVNGLRKRLVALCVGGVDRCPGWKDEYGRMEWVRSQGCMQLEVGQRCDLLKQAERVNDPTIKEHPFGRPGLMKILLDISTQNLASEGDKVWPGTVATGETLCDDGPRRVFNREVAQLRER